ncbi:F-box/FBD/LRR-repeat protein At1g78750, partial [Linum grandiflorum]
MEADKAVFWNRAMTQKKKKQKRSRLGFGGGGVDRISNLPDSIIHHILSFLDTTSAVKTCVLSKQWKCTWKHVDVLNLDLNILANYKTNYSRIETFVDKVLSLRYPFRLSKMLWKSEINDHRSDYVPGSQFGLLRRVVQYAVSHGAQHFQIRPKICRESYTPLSELFESISDSVRSLDLSQFTLDKICCQPPDECSSRFRLLTSLKLKSSYCFVADGVELVEPFSKFPCLKDLVLHNFWFYHNQPVTFRVSGLQLVNFTLIDPKVKRFQIVAPKLKSFRFVSYRKAEFLEMTLPSLVHADFDYSIFSEDDDIVQQQLAVLFHGIHNVESLTLRRELKEAVLQVSKLLEQQPCPFKKLSKLNFGFAPKDEIPYKALDHYFLNGSSNDGYIDIPRSSND